MTKQARNHKETKAQSKAIAEFEKQGYDHGYIADDGNVALVNRQTKDWILINRIGYIVAAHETDPRTTK